MLLRSTQGQGFRWQRCVFPSSRSVGIDSALQWQLLLTCIGMRLC